jgi:hypothetical protein
MPHASFKVIPGVDQNKTPTLNEAALSSCQLIRFMPDRSGLGLVQKLGGWQKFYPSPMPTTPRGLHAWEDTNSVSHLAVGNTASTVNNQASLYVITTGVAQNITPQTVTTNPSPTFNTTINRSTVLVTDAGYPGTSASSVFIATPVAIG